MKRTTALPPSSRKLRAWVLSRASKRKRTHFSIRDRVKDGSLPIAVKRMPGLFDVIGREGLFAVVEHGFRAAYRQYPWGEFTEISLRPATEEEKLIAFDLHVEESEIPF